MIDWITVAAQIVNFLILVALLRHFLYGPIIKAMDQREASIRKRIEGAREREKEAGEKVEDFERRTRELEEKREQMMDEARKKAGEERGRLVQRARQESDEQKQRWREELKREQAAFLDDVRRTIGQQSVEVARRALREMADARLQQQVAAVFAQRLADLDKEARQGILDALPPQDGSIVLRSSVELEPAAMEQIAKQVEKTFSRRVKLRNEIDEDLICGVELVTGNHKISWTLAEYLEQAEREIGALFQTAEAGETGEAKPHAMNDEQREDTEDGAGNDPV